MGERDVDVFTFAVARTRLSPVEVGCMSFFTIVHVSNVIPKFKVPVLASYLDFTANAATTPLNWFRISEDNFSVFLDPAR